MLSSSPVVLDPPSTPSQTDDVCVPVSYLSASAWQLWAHAQRPVEAVPWGQLLSKAPVWALILSHFCHNWGTFILLTWMPSYYNQVGWVFRPAPDTLLLPNQYARLFSSACCELLSGAAGKKCVLVWTAGMGADLQGSRGAQTER